MNRNKKEPRTALLIRCTEEEAKAIREAAKLQRRTVSGFVIHAVMNRIAVQQRVGTAVRNNSATLRTLPSLPSIRV